MRAFAQNQNEPQRSMGSSPAQPNRAKVESEHPEHPILHLQRTLGNRSVQRLLQAHAGGLDTSYCPAPHSPFGHDSNRVPIHTPAPLVSEAMPAAISQPGDADEREAEECAAAIMHMGEPGGDDSATCGEAGSRCEAAHREQSIPPPIVHEVVHSPGQPLDPAARAFAEPLFGIDFSDVRVHTDKRASLSARSVGAAAYTVGRHIVFDEGEFAPAFTQGQRLLVHELTHVVQQSGQNRIAADVENNLPESALDVEAVRASREHQVSGENAPHSRLQTAPVPRLQRRPRGRRAGMREAVVEVFWSEEFDTFYARLLHALARSQAFRGIDPGHFTYSSNTELSLQRMAENFQSRYGQSHSDRKKGQRIKLKVSAFYDPGEDFPLTHKSLSEVVEPGAGNAPSSTEPPRPAPQGRFASDPTFRSLVSSLTHYYKSCSQGGEEPLPGKTPTSRCPGGGPGAHVTLEFDGTRVSLIDWEAFSTWLKGGGSASEAQIEREVDVTFEQLVPFRPARHEIDYCFREDGRLIEQSFRAVPIPPKAPTAPSAPRRPLSSSEEFERETGMLDPRKINKALVQIAVKALHEADPTSLKNLPFTIGSIIVPWAGMKMIFHYDDLGNLIRIERVAAEGEEMAGELNEVRVTTTAGKQVRVSGFSDADIQEIMDQTIAERGEQVPVESRYGRPDDVRTRVNPPTAAPAPADVLGQALRKAGDFPPGEGFNAHHIVPVGAPPELIARVEQAGIHLNDAANGVWVPTSPQVANEYGRMIHQEYLHRYQEEYLATIERRLMRLPEESIPGEIARIKREISSGVFRLYP